MEENNFEKQVQQKMDELKFTPSEAVWDHVKMNIEKRKSRRWLLLIFLFGSIALLSGLYYFSVKNDSSLNNKLAKNNAAIKALDSLSINKGSIPTQESVLKKQRVSKEEKISKEQNASKNKNSHSKISAGSEFKKSNDYSHHSNTEVDILNRKNDQQKIKIPGLKEHENGNVIITATPPQSEVSHLNKINKQDSSNTVEPMPTSVTAENNIDSLSNIVNNKNTIDTSSSQDLAQQIQTQIDTSTTQKPFKNPATKISKKWSVGFLLAGGISHVGNQFLGLGYVSADYLQNATPGSSQGGSISTPSKVKNAFGFIAGVFFEKAMSPKTNFSIGINYKEFNTSNLVGQKIDSVLSYSSVNANKRYNNNFKFIELPLKVKVQLGSNKKLPVYWSGGITLSQLIKSNALQFDPYTSSSDPFAKSYFTDNSFFNETLLGLNTALSASIFSNKKNTILAGPYFYYAASRLANEGLYSKKHFVFFGLQTQIVFNKK